MILKEAYRYQNFLTNLISNAQIYLGNGSFVMKKNKNTHCAWAKIFFHLWLYGEHSTTVMLKLQMNMLNTNDRKQMGGIILFDD